MKRTLEGILVSVAAIVVTCVSLEALARVVRGARGPRPQETLERFEYDPLLGWRKHAGLRMQVRQPEYTVELEINSHGLRDPERGYEAPPGTFRILALGDSFVEAYCVRAEDSVTQALEGELRRSSVPAEVVNGGTGGYGTDQEFLFYESEGLRYGPKVVLLFFYYNDVLYNGQDRALGRAKPLLVAEQDGSLRPRDYPLPRLGPEAVDDEPVRASNPFGSLVLGWLQDRLRASDRRLYNRFTWLWPPIPLHKDVPLEMRVYERQPVHELEFSWTLTRTILKALARDAQGRGIPFLAVYVPSRMEVDDRAWARTKDLYGVSDQAWDRRHVVEILAEIGRESGFPVLDMTPALRAAGAAYYPKDEHWTSVGHRTAAREVAHELEKRGWVPQPAAENQPPP
ncbi:MAG TPA: SGNH/GDSL hydrolase family protein [Vicinamibacteria bacterium]|nr:SGNH/GDSL hydrolase family protein [Vicinamibacteria bacterium]